MSKQIYVFPNGTEINIMWEGHQVGKGTIIDNSLKKGDGNNALIQYKIKIKHDGLFQMFGLSDEHWLNSFEVKPIQKGQ